MPNVSRGESRPAGGGDACDLHITDVEASSSALLLRGDVSGSGRGRDVERLDASLEILADKLVEGVLELRSAAARLEQPQADTHLEHGDRRRPYGLRRLSVEPGDDGRFGLAFHELRNDVRVEEDHSSKRAGRISCPRSSGMSSFSPIRVKRDEMRDPSLAGV